MHPVLKAAVRTVVSAERRGEGHGQERHRSGDHAHAWLLLLFVVVDFMTIRVELLGLEEVGVRLELRTGRRHLSNTSRSERCTPNLEVKIREVNEKEHEGCSARDEEQACAGLGCAVGRIG